MREKDGLLSAVFEDHRAFLLLQKNFEIGVAREGGAVVEISEGIGLAERKPL